jgi:nicotinamide riboside kinase
VRESTQNASRFQRLDELLHTLQHDLMSQTSDYGDKVASEFESQFTREYYLKLINKSMSNTETLEFLDYLACITGLSSTDKFGDYADKFSM